MWIFGIILIAVGVGLIFYKKKLEDKLLNIKYFDQIDINSAVENCLSISKELGTGHYSNMVKIEANAGIDEPLIGEFSEDKCVYFEASAEHEYEQLITTEDNNGKKQRNWVPGYESIGSVKEGGEFWLRDKSGQVDIDILGAELTIKQAVKRFRSTGRSVDFSFGTYSPRKNSKFKSKGYSELERNIPTGQKLFIIGELNDRNGTPIISKPESKENPFIVSIKSEQEVIGSLESKTKNVLFGGIACAVIGSILTVAGLIML